MFASALAFVVIILWINHDLLTVPINEYYDFAANTLQIEDAKHFRTLLGNYSQWGFHHPGPAFFYFFALGEAVLHDWLRVVPAVMNAQLVTMIILNSAFLFMTIGIFAQHCRSRVFLAAGVALSIYFVYMVNHTLPSSALVSIWMPNVLLFPFLLFVTACASVSAGNVWHLPIAAFAGLLLSHGHVAQALFVFPLFALALSAAWLSHGRQTGLEHFIRSNRTPFLMTVVLVVIFALPILLDLTLHRPNNIQHILVHMATHPGLQHDWLPSLKYETSFFVFLRNPDAVLQNAWAQLISTGASHPYVSIYWSFCFCLAALTIGRLVFRSRPVPAFLKYLTAEIIAVMLLFFYWSTRISGSQYAFHGHFFYSVQLLMLLGMGCLALDGVAPTLNRAYVVVVSCAIPLLTLMGKPYFLSGETGLEETGLMIASLPPDIGPVHFTFPNDDWHAIVGVASHMKREGHRFCVTDNYWGLFFGRENLCDDDMTGLHNLIFTHAPAGCEAPCRTLVQDPRFVLQLSPYPWLKLPFRLGDSIASLNENFYGEGGGLWSSKKSTIHFLLAPDSESRPARLRITGAGLPARPVEVSLNGRHLGTIRADQGIFESVVDGDVLKPGQENGLLFEVEKAGPVPHDWRVLGFFINKVEFEAFDGSR